MGRLNNKRRSIDILLNYRTTRIWFKFSYLGTRFWRKNKSSHFFGKVHQEVIKLHFKLLFCTRIYSSKVQTNVNSAKPYHKACMNVVL